MSDQSLRAPEGLPLTAPVRARRDGHRPASEETWFCPNCGRPATTFVAFTRTIVCLSCKWTFDVNLGQPFGVIGSDPYDWARKYAEQLE